MIPPFLDLRQNIFHKTSPFSWCCPGTCTSHGDLPILCVQDHLATATGPGLVRRMESKCLPQECFRRLPTIDANTCGSSDTRLATATHPIIPYHTRPYISLQGFFRHFHCNGCKWLLAGVVHILLWCCLSTAPHTGHTILYNN